MLAVIGANRSRHYRARNQRPEPVKSAGREMAAITTAAIAIVAVILAWVTIETACKPCLEKGREAIDRSLDPNYDPDDSLAAAVPADAHQPLLAPPPAEASTAKTI